MNHSDACNRVRLAVSRIGGLILEYKTGALKDEPNRISRRQRPDRLHWRSFYRC